MLSRLYFILVLLICSMKIFILKFVDYLYGSKSHVIMTNLKSFLSNIWEVVFGTGVVIMDASLDFRFQCSAKLNSRRSPVVKHGLFIFIPHVCSAQQNIARLFCQTARMALPIVSKYPLLKIGFNSSGIAS